MCECDGQDTVGLANQRLNLEIAWYICYYRDKKEGGYVYS